MFEMTRKGFLGGGLALMGATALPKAGGAATGERKRLLRFGVATDVHVSELYRKRPNPKFTPELNLEKALKWFDREGVEAVAFTGDFAHEGRVWELKRFAEIWNGVFPKNVAADGRKVEMMLVTGNHEFALWPWTKSSHEEQCRERLAYNGNMERLWEELFGLKYELIWKRQVKDVTFIGSQWQTIGGKQNEHPDIIGWFKRHRGEIDPYKPFFYLRHEHPFGTCYGQQQCCGESLPATLALADWHYGVALSGHTHNSLVDERSVWQGSFTSIGCGCTHEAGPAVHGYREKFSGFVGYRNQHPCWVEPFKRQPMSEVWCWGNDGGGCLIVDVYADGLEIMRHSINADAPFGPNWKVPLPARAGGPLDDAQRAWRRAAPEFPAGAKVTVEATADSAYIGPALKGKPCVLVTFPWAETVKGTRVYDYVVRAYLDGREVADAAVLSTGYMRPEPHDRVDGACLFGRHELPVGKDLVFSVTPRDCFGVAGSTLLSAPFRNA